MGVRHWQREHPSLLLWLALLIVVGLSGIVIVQGAAAPAPHPMDQGFLSSADLRLNRVADHWVFQYPHLQWSGGISSTGAVGIYKLLIDPSPAFLNWHIKLAVMVIWFASLLYLIRSLLTDQVVGALVLLGAGALGLQFLEPTSELIAGIFFNFFMLLICRQRFLLGGIALALFGLAKVELLAPSLLVMGYVSWRYQRSDYIPFLIGYFFAITLLVAPALYLHGGEGVLGGRDLVALEAHYRWLFAEDLSAGTRRPFEEAFHNPTSFGRAVLLNPWEYANFIGNSIVLSIRNLFVAAHFYIFGFLGMFWLGKYWRPARETMGNDLNAAAQITFILIISTLIISIVFAFVHVRYASRFAGLLVVIFAAMLEQTCRRPEKYWRTPPATGRCLSALRIALGMLALGSLLRVPWFAASPHNW